MRNGPKVNPNEVDGRVAQLRAQAKEEQACKVEPGDTARGKAKATAKSKEKASWAVPEDYQGPVTAMEQELGDLGQGPDREWHQRFAQGAEMRLPTQMYQRLCLGCQHSRRSST